MKSRRGQSILYAVLLMPTLILVLSLTIDIAQLQMQRLRFGYAVDLATVSAASSVDPTYYMQSGRLRLDEQAALTVTRAYLERNLAQSIGAGPAARVAAAAEITIINRVPSTDPYTGRRIDRPSVCARIRVPYRLAFGALLGGLGNGRLRLSASAEIRS